MAVTIRDANKIELLLGELKVEKVYIGDVLVYGEAVTDAIITANEDVLVTQDDYYITYGGA